MLFSLSSPVRIETRLTRDEVIQRLSSKIPTPGVFFPILGPFGMIVGRVGPYHCWFENARIYQRVNRRLNLRYAQGPTGITLEGELAFPPLMRSIMVITLCVGVLTGVRFVIDVLQGRAGHPGLVPSTFLLGTILLLPMKVWLLRGTEQELIDIVSETLAGSPQSAFWRHDDSLTAPNG